MAHKRKKEKKKEDKKKGKKIEKKQEDRKGEAVKGVARREEGEAAEGKKSRRKRRGRAIITTGLTVSRPDAVEQSCKKISTPPTPRVEGPEVSYSCVKAPPLQVIRTRPYVSNAWLRISKRSLSLVQPLSSVFTPRESTDNSYRPVGIFLIVTPFVS